jgi:hypothetical protein
MTTFGRSESEVITPILAALEHTTWVLAGANGAAAMLDTNCRSAQSLASALLEATRAPLPVGEATASAADKFIASPAGRSTFQLRLHRCALPRTSVVRAPITPQRKEHVGRSKTSRTDFRRILRS